MKKAINIILVVSLLGASVIFMGKAFLSFKNSSNTEISNEEDPNPEPVQNNDVTTVNAPDVEIDSMSQVNDMPADEDILAAQDDTQQSSDTQKLPDDVTYIDGVAYNNLHAETRVDFDYPDASEKTWEKRITDEGKEYNIFLHDLKGDYNIQFFKVEMPRHFSVQEDEKPLQNVCDEKNFRQDRIMTYEEYAEYCAKYDLSKEYDNQDQNYIVTAEETGSNSSVNYFMRIADLKKINSSKIDIYYAMSGKLPHTTPTHSAGFITVIPVDKSITEYEYCKCITEEQFDNYNDPNYHPKEEKPVIYLYPKEKTDIGISLSAQDRVTCSYPKLKNTWHVKADPNGTLTDLETGRKLYCLYYEAKANKKFKVQSDGFVVKSEDIAAFLEEKLSILGLNEREAEEFIIYWLPKLEENPYNYIRFAESSEIENEMRLEINPKPDTTIRILMTYKGLDQPIEVSEQTLVQPKRKGFVAVEWGGTMIP